MPAPQILKCQAEFVKEEFLRIRHVPDDFRFRQTAGACKALAYAVFGTRTWDDKFHLREIRKRPIVEIGNVLIREKVSDGGIRSKQFESAAH